ncbi:hypothetical protein GQ457_15G029810 [Hibiscus cannabinus]
MGFNQTVKRNATAESNVVIGVIDSGIWPDSDSFSDEGFGPPPQKWKGSCKDSARDRVGHGSHTASTAAGNHVGNASFYGLAEGTARGGVPSARIAAYKVCDDTGHCTTENILAGFDDAIADGVDLLTVSIISFIPSELYDDPVSIGAFHAAEKGILVMQSAGNNGPVAQSVNSVAPWLLSVAASTTDRFFIDRVVLGNGKTLTGMRPRLLEQKFGKDKIVVCDELVYGLPEARDAGALGTILRTPLQNISIVVPLPASALGTDDYSSLMSYLNSTKQAEAELLKTESIEDSSAPVVAIFSSRGPNIIPDISAPGVDILAAYSPVASPSEVGMDKRRVKIQSFPMDPAKNSDAELAYGSGHVNPVKAINPGLVYDNAEGDNVRFLCSIGYSEEKIRAISGTNSSCPKTSPLPRNFNYPTLSALVKADGSFTVKFQRTVTNVGVATSTYNATISSSPKLEVTVIPQVLSFKTLWEKKSYNVTVTGKAWPKCQWRLHH